MSTPGSWEASLTQVITHIIMFPLMFVGVAVWRERNIMLNAPAVAEDDPSSIDIRSRDEGELLTRVRGRTLVGVSLPGAKLRAASLHGTDLTRAQLRGADLTCAWLKHANLEGADLRAAKLKDAAIEDTVLRGADLCGADLRVSVVGRRILPDVDLEGAVYDRATLWPRGFDPQARGCVFVDNTPAPDLPLPGEAQPIDTLPLPAVRLEEPPSISVRQGQ